MTKHEFCKKWKSGWRKVYYDGQQEGIGLSEKKNLTLEQMLNDLNLVVYSEFCGWKKFVDAEIERSVDLDEWQRAEAEAIENRKN